MPDPKGPDRRNLSRPTRHGYTVPHEAGDDDFADELTVIDPPKQPKAPVPAPPAAYGAPAAPARYPAAPAQAPAVAPVPMHAPAPDAPPPGGGRRPPAVEVVVVQEHRVGLVEGMTWRAVEIWTRNRIYGLDANMVCIEVLNRATNRPEPTHSFLGAKMTGGQRVDGSAGAMELAQPFPVPGMEAVFKHSGRRHGRYGQTSKVERVVLRVHVTSHSPMDSEPLWDEITGSHKVR